jgi:formylglycine-generating enzyme
MSMRRYRRSLLASVAIGWGARLVGCSDVHDGPSEHASGGAQVATTTTATGAVNRAQSKGSCAGELPGAGDNCGLTHDDDCCASLPVPGGSFNRLNDPRYPATVSSFYLDKYLVTVGRFRRYLEQTGGPTRANPPRAGAGAHPRIPDSGWDPAWNTMLADDTAALDRALVCDPNGWPTWTDAPGTNEKKPMVCATWIELFAFCAWDGGRLPTQAEMNYAAAGGDEQRLYPWGSSPITTADASWCCQGDGSVSGPCVDSYCSWDRISCTRADMTDVGSFPAGAGRWGQLDLAGDAYKVTRDGADNYAPLTPCVDCSRLDNTSSSRVTHGGSFVAPGYRQTTTYRAPYGTDVRQYYVSAMCARDLPAP